jgi:hypothetical protein
MAKSPAVILYDANGVALAVADGETIPDGTPGLLIAGTDAEGDEARFLRASVDRHGDTGLVVSLAPVEITRILDALAGIENQLKILVGHMECVTDEKIKVKEKKK